MKHLDALNPEKTSKYPSDPPNPINVSQFSVLNRNGMNEYCSAWSKLKLRLRTKGE